jgi:hypothetical protein
MSAEMVAIRRRMRRPPGPDAAAEAGQFHAVAGEPRQHVLQLREFNLRLPLPRPRPPGEDIENQLRPVDHTEAKSLLEVPELRRGQLLIADHHVDPLLVAGERQLLDLPASQEGRRVRLRAFLDQAQRHQRAGRRHETAQLIERLIGLVSARPAGRESDECGAFVAIQDVTPDGSVLLQAF